MRPAGVSFSLTRSENLVLRSMTEAFQELFPSNATSVVTRLRVFAFVGNITQQGLENHHDAIREDTELRLLIRDPKKGVVWAFPPNSEKRQSIRKGEIRRNIERLQNHQALFKMKHQKYREPLSVWVRFHALEMPVFHAIADTENGGQIGYIGFYRPVKRGGEQDYSGSDFPVLKVTDATILAGVTEWFDHYWETLARRPSDAADLE